MRDIKLERQRRRDVDEFSGGKNWGMRGLLPQMWWIYYGVSQYNFVYGLPGMRCSPCCVREERQGTVFDDNRSEEELAKKRHARLTGYAAKLNKLGKQQLDLQLNIYEDAREIAGLVAGSGVKRHTNE